VQRGSFDRFPRREYVHIATLAGPKKITGKLNSRASSDVPNPEALINHREQKRLPRSVCTAVSFCPFLSTLTSFSLTMITPESIAYFSNS